MAKSKQIIFQNENNLFLLKLKKIDLFEMKK